MSRRAPPPPSRSRFWRIWPFLPLPLLFLMPFSSSASVVLLLVAFFALPGYLLWCALGLGLSLRQPRDVVALCTNGVLGFIALGTQFIFWVLNEGRGLHV